MQNLCQDFLEVSEAGGNKMDYSNRIQEVKDNALGCLCPHTHLRLENDLSIDFSNAPELCYLLLHLNTTLLTWSSGKYSFISYNGEKI